MVEIKNRILLIFILILSLTIPVKMFADESSFIVKTFAGTGHWGSQDGPVETATFTKITDIIGDTEGNLYVADRYNYCIRKISQDGIVTTFAGQSGTSGFQAGQGNGALLGEVIGLTIDSNNNLYVTDILNHCIWKITSNANVTVFAGGNGSGWLDGSSETAKFSYPVGITNDSQNNVYIADTGNHVIRKIDTSGIVFTIAGEPRVAGYQDGNGDQVRFNKPKSILAHNDGNLYVSDSNNYVIRKINQTNDVSTIAGMPGAPGYADGEGTEARFREIFGIYDDLDGNLYIADRGNNVIRRSTTDGIVETAAGLAGQSGFVDGAADDARFNEPMGVYIDPGNFMYITDSNNLSIRMVKALKLGAHVDLNLLSTPPEEREWYYGSVKIERVFSVYQNLTERKMHVLHTFFDWKSNFFGVDVNTANSHGYDLMYSWEPFLIEDPSTEEDIVLTNQIIIDALDNPTGQYSYVYDYIQQFAQDVKKTGHTFYLRMAHEMNGYWYPWATVNQDTLDEQPEYAPCVNNTPQSYVEMWQKIHDLFVTEGATNAKWVWCPNIIAGQIVDFTPYYPGSNYVDIIGIDGYNFQEAPDESMQEVFTSNGTMSKLKALDPFIPIWICETSSYENGNKGDWWRNGFELAKSVNRIQSIINFHEEKECDWRVNSTLDSLNGFKDGQADFLYNADPGSLEIISTENVDIINPPDTVALNETYTITVNYETVIEPGVNKILRVNFLNGSNYFGGDYVYITESSGTVDINVKIINNELPDIVSGEDFSWSAFVAREDDAIEIERYRMALSNDQVDNIRMISDSITYTTYPSTIANTGEYEITINYDLYKHPDGKYIKVGLLKDQIWSWHGALWNGTEYQPVEIPNSTGGITESVSGSITLTVTVAGGNDIPDAGTDYLLSTDILNGLDGNPGDDWERATVNEKSEHITIVADTISFTAYPQTIDVDKIDNQFNITVNYDLYKHPDGKYIKVGLLKDQIWSWHGALWNGTEYQPVEIPNSTGSITESVSGSITLTVTVAGGNDIPDAGTDYLLSIDILNGLDGDPGDDWERATVNEKSEHITVNMESVSFQSIPDNVWTPNTWTVYINYSVNATRKIRVDLMTPDFETWRTGSEIIVGPGSGTAAVDVFVPSTFPSGNHVWTVYSANPGDDHTMVRADAASEQFWVARDPVYIEAHPTVIQRGNTYDITLNWEVFENSHVVIELVKDQIWTSHGRAEIIVPAGIGMQTLQVTIDGDTPIGSDYFWSAWVSPDGTWENHNHQDRKFNITIE